MSDNLHKTKKTTSTKKGPNPKLKEAAKKNKWLNFLKEYRLNHEYSKTILSEASAAYHKLGEKEIAAYGIDNFQPKQAGGGSGSNSKEK